MSRRERWAIAAGCTGLWAWWVATAPFGIDLSDEGYIVYPAAQVAQGLVPYRDINSLYTPLVWYLHAALFALTGVELLPLRLVFAAVASALVLGVYLVARQHTSPRLAMVSAVAYALVFPLPQVWAPYPAWYALGGLLAGLLAMGRWVEDGQRRWLVATGLGCAWAFGAKPSLGLFGLMGFCGFLLLRARSLQAVQGPASDVRGTSLGGTLGEPVRTARRATVSVVTWAQWLFVVLVAAVVWLLLRGVATPGNQLLLVGTVTLAAIAAIEPGRSDDPAAIARATAARGGWILAPFVVATTLWYVPLSVAAGWELAFDSVFRAGARTAAAFHQPVLPPNADAVEVLAVILLGAAIVGGAALSARTRLLKPRTVLAGSALLLGLVVSFAWWRAVASGQGLLPYLVSNVQARLSRPAGEETDLLMYLPFMLAWLGSGLLLWRRLRRRPANPVAEARLALLVWLSPLVLLQIYPHASYRHLLFSVGPFLALGGVLRAELWRWAGPRLPSGAWRAAAFLLLLLFPAVLVPSSLRARAVATELSAPLGLAHASGLRVAEGDRARMAFVAERFALLPLGAPVFAYPAMPMVYLLTDHPNPTRESYLPPGYVDEARQRDAIARLEASRTRFVVWDQDLVAQWGLTEQDRPLVDYIWSSYRQVASQGSWLLLERAP